MREGKRWERWYHKRVLTFHLLTEWSLEREQWLPPGNNVGQMFSSHSPLAHLKCELINSFSFLSFSASPAFTSNQLSLIVKQQNIPRQTLDSFMRWWFVMSGHYNHVFHSVSLNGEKITDSLFRASETQTTVRWDTRKSSWSGRRSRGSNSNSFSSLISFLFLGRASVTGALRSISHGRGI